MYDIPKIIHQTWKTNEIPEQFIDIIRHYVYLYGHYVYLLVCL